MVPDTSPAIFWPFGPLGSNVHRFAGPDVAARVLPLPLPRRTHGDAPHSFLRLTKTLDVAFSTFRVYPSDFVVR